MKNASLTLFNKTCLALVIAGVAVQAAADGRIEGQIKATDKGIALEGAKVRIKELNREAVSQRVIGRFLAGLFDAVITVDPHLHRVATLEEAIPVKDAIVLSGAPLLADHIATQRQNPLLMGPDEEALQWVALAAARHGWDHAVCRKTRHGDCEVDIELPDLPVAGRAVVLMDDVASSGHTLARAAGKVP